MGGLKSSHFIALSDDNLTLVEDGARHTRVIFGGRCGQCCACCYGLELFHGFILYVFYSLYPFLAHIKYIILCCSGITVGKCASGFCWPCAVACRLSASACVVPSLGTL